MTLGTTGTDLSSSVATGTTTPVITLNVPTASATNRGALSSADWTTFNGKESVLTFSSPLVRTTNTISIPVATTSVNGYLSSTDWTTFNGKQGALTLTTTGTSGAATLVGNTLNIPQYSGGGGSITLSAIGSTPNANAATLTGSVLNLEPASASFGGVVTTGTQTFAGLKTFNGNVGIGFAGQTNIGLFVYKSHATDYAFVAQQDGAGPIAQFSGSGGTSRMYIASGGNVGIGTLTIGSTLQVNGNAAIGYSASTAAPTNGLAVSGSVVLGAISSTEKLSVNGGINVTNGTVNNIMSYSSFGIFGTTSNHDISFYTNNIAQVRLTTGGNFGIGTTTIGSKLQVNGNAAIGYSASTAAPTNGLVVSGNSGFGLTSPVARLHCENAASAEPTALGNAPTTNVFGMSTSPGGMLAMGVGSTGGTYVWLQGRNTGAAGVSYNIALNQLGGSVGIGLSGSSVGSRLQVNGNAAIGYSASTAAPTDGLVVSGNVGIGTLTPLVISGFKTLEVKGTTAGLVGVSTSTVFGRMYSGSINMHIGTSTNHPIIFDTNDLDRLTITSGGLIGINTNTIGSQLQVNGNAAIGYSASTAAPTNGLAVAGITKTAGLSLSGTTVSTSQTITDSIYMWVFNGGASQTLTLYNTSGHNNTHFIKNSSANILTLAASSIETKTSTTTVTSISIAAYQTVEIISNGGAVWIVMN